MARMLQALKNLEAKVTRPPASRVSAAPAAAIVAKSAAVAATATNAPSAAPVAPHIIEVVDKLEAVVGYELGGVAAPNSLSQFAVAPAFAYSDFASFAQPQSAGIPVPAPDTAASNQRETKATAAALVVREPCELERQVKRTLSNPIRCQPLVELVDRLLRDMQQTESKVLGFVGLGVSGDSYLPILQAATVLAEKRGKHVLLIDGDFSDRALSKGLEYGRCAGLSELVAGKAEIATVCQATATQQLSFIGAGQLAVMTGSAAEEALEKALAKLKADFDCIFIHAGGAGGGLASALAETSDAAYLVVELGAVEANTAQAALARLRAGGARVLGCIAT